MLTKRMKHSCEKLSENSVLVSGGKALLSGDLLHDEIYFWEDGMSTAIEAESSLMRFQHQLVRIEETIFALGGLTEQKKDERTVMKFKKGTCDEKGATYCWTKHETNLIFKDVANLVLTSFPQSAIDCGIQCRCGTERSKKRIIGGVESEVCTKDSICSSIEIVTDLFTASALSLDCSYDNGQEPRCFLCPKPL